MKKYVYIFLFLLGGAEILFSVLVSLRIYSYEPHFADAFDISKFSHEQLELYWRFLAAMRSTWVPAGIYFGVATIVIGILLLVADRKKGL